MAFNHYAKLGRIVAELDAGWYIVRIDEPTSTKNFRGEVVSYDHYYRLYSQNGSQVPYGKFQKIDKLAGILDTPIEALPVVEQTQL